MSRAGYIRFLTEQAKRKKVVWTLSELRESARKNRPKFNKSRPTSILSMTPTMSNKTLTVKAEARGTSLYPLVITFYNVDYTLEADPAYPLSVQTKTGATGYAKQVTEDGNPVQLRCQCMDFRHTWAFYDHKAKALSGRPFPRYERKTTTRPSRNPGEVPGLCKHLIGMVEVLKRRNILK